MNNQDVITKDGEIYLSPKAVMTIIIDIAVNETELKPCIKCRKIVKEMSKLMAIRRYGGSATEIFRNIIQIKEPRKQKDFVSHIYNKYIYPEDIRTLLCNIEI